MGSKYAYGYLLINYGDIIYNCILKPYLIYAHRRPPQSGALLAVYAVQKLPQRLPLAGCELINLLDQRICRRVVEELLQHDPKHVA